MRAPEFIHDTLAVEGGAPEQQRPRGHVTPRHHGKSALPIEAGEATQALVRNPARHDQKRREALAQAEPDVHQGYPRGLRGLGREGRALVGVERVQAAQAQPLPVAVVAALRQPLQLLRVQRPRGPEAGGLEGQRQLIRKFGTLVLLAQPTALLLLLVQVLRDGEAAVHGQHVTRQHVFGPLLAALRLQPRGFGRVLQRGLGEAANGRVLDVLVLVLHQLFRGEGDVTAECKVMPERGRKLYFVDQFAKGFDLFGRDLVVEGGSNELEGAGPELDALLERLVDLADVLVERESLLARQ